MTIDDTTLPKLVIAGTILCTIMSVCTGDELKERNYKGKIDNCLVTRKAGYQSGWCLDCPDTAIETLEVRCATETYLFTDIHADGKVDLTKTVKDGSEVTNRRKYGRESEYQATFDKWQKKISENR